MQKQNRSFFTRFTAVFLALILLFAGGCTKSGSSLGQVRNISSSEKEEASSFNEFLNSAFQELVNKDTLSLHFTLRSPETYGVSAGDVSFPDLSPDGVRKTYETYNTLLKRLEDFSYRDLTSRQQLVYDTLHTYLSWQKDFADYPYYEELLSPSSGVHLDLPILLSEYVFASGQDVDDYINLLNLTDIYFSQVLAYEDKKIEQGLAMTDAAYDRVITFCNTFGTEAENHLLLSCFREKIMNADFLSDLEKEKYISANETAVKDKVLPSYRALAKQLEERKGHCVNTQGLAHSSRGRAYYTLLAKQASGTTDAPFLLFYQISRQRDLDMQTMTALFSTDPTLASRCAGYQFEATDPAQMLSLLQEAIKEDFPACENASASVGTVSEALAPYTAPAFYLVAPLDDYNENIIYYNPSKVTSNLDLFTTIAHEGFPGHLYQTVMSYSYGLEPIRSMLSFPGYTEGWATYVEMLSYRYAGMDTALSSVLQLNYSVILSLYASADIGIHYYGWDVSKTTAFFAEYGVTDPDVIDEIYQMILWDPANYLKYYMGYLSFLTLQQKMADKFPDVFSLYEFHKCIVATGPTSFTVLEEQLSDYFSELSDSAANSSR